MLCTHDHESNRDRGSYVNKMGVEEGEYWRKREKEVGKLLPPEMTEVVSK